MTTANKHIASPSADSKAKVLAAATASAKTLVKSAKSLPTKAAPVVTAAQAELIAAETAANEAKVQKDFFAARRVRRGKTRKDAANGAKAKNQQNRDTRAMWQGDSKRTTSNFPFSACNGHRNVYQYTGPCGITVYTRTQVAASSKR
jgi:hypothetical protein